MHARGDARVPLELGRQLAAAIPAPSLAHFNNNHVLGEHDPAMQLAMGMDRRNFGTI